MGTVAHVADNLTPDQRRRSMRSGARGRDTKPELALRAALWARGVRGYRVHDRRVFGRPDIVFLRRRVAVFVDGAFWHGHPDFYQGQSGEFWDRKIARNQERDKQVNSELALAGWTVVRLWDFEVARGLDDCVRRVTAALDASKDADAG